LGDRRTRQLERLWGGGGDEEARAALVAERIRRGEIDAERARLASYVGHPVAQELVPTDSPLDLEGWLDGLGDWPGVRARAAFSALWTVAPRLWREPLPVHRNRLALVAKSLLTPEKLTARERVRLASQPRGSQAILEVLHLAGRLAAGDTIEPPRRTLRRVVGQAAKIATYPLVVRRIEDDLEQWALDLADPVAGRRDPLEDLWSLSQQRQSRDLYLLRFRFGDLRRAELDLAARLGDGPARQAVKWIEDELPEICRDPHTLAEEFAEIGQRALAVLAWAAARDAAPDWTSRHPGDTTQAELLEAIQTWLEKGSLEGAKRVQALAELAYAHDEPPWAAYRAGLTLRAGGVKRVIGYGAGALRWALATRVAVAAGQAQDYRLRRRLETGRLDRLEAAEREALGLSDVENLGETAAAAGLLDSLAELATPRLVKAMSAELSALIQDAPNPSPPGKKPRTKKRSKKGKKAPAIPETRLRTTSPAWESYAALAPEAALDELRRRVKAKELKRKALRLAAHLGHAPAGALLDEVGAAWTAPDTYGGAAWADQVWTLGGVEAWARMVLACLERRTSYRSLHPLRGALARWLIDARDMDLDDVHAAARGAAAKIWRGGDRDPSATDELRAEWSTALLSIRARRTKAVAQTAPLLGSLADREGIEGALLPWALGLVSAADAAAPPEGAEARSYSIQGRFLVDEWIHHAKFGVGQVAAVTPRQIEVRFSDERRKLTHRR
jgi:hypothetical protein